MIKPNIHTVRLPILCESASFCITKQKYHLQIVVNDVPFEYDSIDITGYSLEYSNTYVGSTVYIVLTLEYQFGLDCITMNNNLNVLLPGMNDGM